MKKTLSFIKFLFKNILKIILFLLVLLILVFFLIQIPFIQTKLVQKISTTLSNSIGTDVEVGKVSINYLSQINIQKILIRDKSKDTMIYINNFNTKYSIFSFKEYGLNNKDISIDGVRFYLVKEKDSILNLNKVFGSKTKDSTSTSKVKPTNSKSIFDNINFNTLNISDFQFKLTNIPRKQVISVSTSKLTADLNSFKIKDTIFKIKNLELDQLKIGFDIAIRKKNTDKEVPEFLDLPLNIDVDKLIVHKGSFKLLDLNSTTRTTYHNLALNDVNVSQLEIDADNVEMRKGHLNALLNNLSCVEKSGLELKKIKTDFKLSSYQMVAKNLIFITNKSDLRGFLQFDYSHMIDYLHFCNKVKITSKLTNSKFHVFDLAFFVTSLMPYQNDYIKFSSNFKGLLNDLNLTNFTSITNDNAIINGAINIKSLFPIKDLNIQANLSQMILKKTDIERFIPNLKLPNELEKFGATHYVGSFNGSPYNFEFNGILNTKIGHATIQHAKMDIRDIKQPNYSGQIKLTQFDLAEIVSINPSINHINADLDISGQGFKFKDLNTKIKGTISSIEINKSIFNSISVDGLYQDNIFKGSIASNDPTLKFKTDGLFSFKENSPNMSMNFSFDNLDLKKLKITSKNLFLKSNANFNFSGKNIDEFLGEVNLNNLSIKEVTEDYSKVYTFSDLNLTSIKLPDNIKVYNIHSEEIEGEIKGHFIPSELVKVLKEYFLGYLSFKDSKVDIENMAQTHFDANIRLNKIKNYSTLFVQHLKNIDSGSVQMSFNGDSNKLFMHGDFKNITYDNLFIPNITIGNNSSMVDFNTILKVDSVFLNKKLAITPLVTSLSKYEKGLKLSAELLNRSDKNFVDFNAYIYKETDDYYFKILPFNSYFDRKIWQVDNDNSIIYNPKLNSLIVKDVTVYKEDQKIVAKTVYQDGYNNLVQLVFDNVRLNEIISGFLPNLKGLHGDINGEIAINNILDKPAPIANININNIIINKDTIGDLKLESSFENEIVQSNLNLIGRNLNLNINGMYNSDVSIDSVNLNILLNKFNPKILNPYLTDYLYDMDGNIKAKLNLLGKLSRPQLLGKVDIDSLNTTINTIHTRYRFDNQTVLFQPNLLVFKNLLFKDVYGNIAEGNGVIKHKNLKNIALDLNVISDKIYCLNTTNLNNQNFYGQVFAGVNASFTGAIDNRITISAKGQNLPGSKIVIVFNNSQQLENYNFYEFINKNEVQDSLTLLAKKKRLGGVNLDFDFDINNSGKLSIIMDPTVDDRIDCSGEGKIAFKMSPESDMDIKGSYIINSGSYLFTYKNFIQRTFYLNKGGNITFTGNPYESNIDASATFKARANAQDLVTAFFGESADATILSAAKNPVKANVILKMKNKLKQPDISYELDIQQNNSNIQSAFESIENITASNPEELNRQVFYLLAFQRFFPPNVTGFEKVSNNNVGRDFSNLAIGIVTSKLSGHLTDLLSGTFTGLNVNIDYKNLTQNYTSTRNELKLALSQKLFNDRLVFNAGGNYNFGQNDLNNNNSSFFGGDFDLEYLLSQSGELRAKFYTTLDRDPLYSKYINKTGVGIVYSKEFENLIDFLRIRRKKQLKVTE